MIVNQNTFDIKSEITDDWGDFYKVVLNLDALNTVDDWKIGLSLPSDYEVDQIYGAELNQEGGQNYISGSGWTEDLNQGETAEVVLIIKEGNNQNSRPMLPELLFANSETSTSPISSSDFDYNSQIAEDWFGGYKLEIDLTAQSDLQNWQADFSLPHTIRAAYGVDIVEHGNNNYTMSGQNGWSDLQSGQTIKTILIIDDYGQQAVTPEFTTSDSAPVVEATPVVSEQPETIDSSVNEPVANEPSKPVLEGIDESTVAQPNGNGRIIDVNNEYSGNLENAIAAANDGDVVLLGSQIYYTNGLTIDKDITLDGQEGTIINGGGTSNPIINLTQEADGATIQDLEITNGNNGIYAYKAFDLTLQNLNINNIGISETLRGAQHNTGIVLNGVDGLRLLDSTVENVGRKGVGVNDTDGALVSGLTVREVNLAAQHSQSYDAAGIKFFNTNDVTVQDSYFSDLNAISIWNDTTKATTIDGNVVEGVGEDFLKPSFDSNVNITGIYNEKSVDALISNNRVTAIDGFVAFNATEFSTETMTLENNDFSSIEVNTQDYWVNESAERLIATTEDPDEANFDLFADEYFAQANIGDV